MGDAGLVDWARRFVELSEELETVRGEIKRAVLNGVDPHPFRSAVRPRPGGTGAGTKEILRLLAKEPNLGTTAIARAMNAKVDTTTSRLKRLRARGAIEGGGASGWRVTASPA